MSNRRVRDNAPYLGSVARALQEPGLSSWGDGQSRHAGRWVSAKDSGIAGGSETTRRDGAFHLGLSSEA